MRVFLFLFVLTAFVSCSEGKSDSPVNKCASVDCEEWQTCNSENGMCETTSGRCATNDDCYNNKICNESHYCINETNPCDGITCSSHGDCEVINNSPVCNCDEGFEADGLNCVEIISDVCNGVTCSNNGYCVNRFGAAMCECKYNYVSVTGTDCTHLYDLFYDAINTQNESKLQTFWDNYDGPIRKDGKVLFVTRGTEGETLKLAGTFNGWNQNTHSMTSTFNTTFKFQEIYTTDNSEIWYKYIGGGWYADPNNMYFKFNDDDNSIVYPENSSRLIRFNLNSTELDDTADRIIYVYLPAEYFSSYNKYPVMYMQDGNNLLNGSPYAPFGTWDVDLNADEAIENDMAQPVIIVGITPLNRNNEYLHTIVDRLENTPKLQEYTNYLINTLKPFIDNNFRTLTDKNNTAIAGSSLGGISSFFIAWQNPDVFGKAGVFSPSSWINIGDGEKATAEDSMISLINSTTTIPELKIYIDSGDSNFDTTKTYDADSRVYTDWVRNLLIRKGFDGRSEYNEPNQSMPVDYEITTLYSTVPTLFWSKNTPNGYSDYYDYLKPQNNLLHIVGEGHMHNEPAWSQRFYGALIFLFPKE